MGNQHIYIIICGIKLQKSTLTPESHIFLENTHPPESKMGTRVFLLQSTKPHSFPKVIGFYEISENRLKMLQFAVFISHNFLRTKANHPT
ncbi:hypothetical protein XENTR_v10023150 [Xenopus tropicalis]|nr:hypothetical protein XENTR_v10023150 [Xenopus tropicalis]